MIIHQFYILVIFAAYEIWRIFLWIMIFMIRFW